MTREEAISTIRRHEAELRALGALRVSVFGSTARWTPAGDSDVDLVIHLDDGILGFDRLDRLDQLNARFMQIMGCAVDVIEDRPRSARLRAAIQRVLSVPTKHPRRRLQDILDNVGKIRCKPGWEPAYDDLDTIARHALDWEPSFSTYCLLKWLTHPA